MDNIHHQLWGLLAFLAATIFSSNGYADDQGGPNQESFVLGKTDVTAATVQPGQTVSFSSDIESLADVSNLIVYLQIFDADKRSVTKTSWSTQNFARRETKSYSLDWSVPTLQYEGEYAVSVGIFDGNWKLIQWFDRVHKVVVVGPEPDSLAVSKAEPLPRSSLTLDHGLFDQFPDHFGLGVKADRRGDFDWLVETDIPFDYRYGYLAGGVNTRRGWANWGARQGSRPGEYAYRFMTSSDELGYIPAFSYYQIVQSKPNKKQEPPYNNLINPSTMRAYFEDWILLMETIADFGKPVIVHHEPDLWGFLQRKGDDPADARVAVGSSGIPALDGMEDNARGLAQALVKLRNELAPNAILAWHATQWATGPDLTLQNADGAVVGKKVAAYFNRLQAPFDLMFYGPSDRDAVWRQIHKKQQEAWWDEDDYVRFFKFITTINQETDLRGMVWQIPLGNTVYRSQNNTSGHYQDNHVEYYLLPENRQNILDHADIGIIALLFGGGFSKQTSYRDVAEDGITNPEPINGNNAVAEFADDDGGFLRLSTKAFYDQPHLQLP